MRKVAIVSAASRQEEKMLDNEVEMMVPLISEVREETGLDQTEIGFTCSGSSDFLAGQAFSFVMTLDAVGPVPLFQKAMSKWMGHGRFMKHGLNSKWEL